MSEQQNWQEFTRFVPGFDFLRNLVPPGLAGVPAQPSGASSAFQQWLAPTMDADEVQKRIDELRVVKFWLEQNGRALEATIQALEVQKMTLTTLKSMNVGAQQMATAFNEQFKESSDRSAQVLQAAMPEARQAPAATPDAASAARADAAADASSMPSAELAAGMAEVQQMQAMAMQWWGALTEQFQNIASRALEDIGENIAAQAAAEPQPAPAEESAAPAQAASKRAAAPATNKPATRRAATPSAAAGAPAAKKPVRKAAAKPAVKRSGPRSP